MKALLMRTAHYKKVFNEFGLKDLGEYHDLYVQSDTLLLANVFENFRDKFIEIYKLDPAHFLSARGLAWQACLKKQGVQSELLTGHDMLMMVKKGIRGRICQAIHRYEQQIINIREKIMMKTMNHYIQNIWMQIICMDG